MSENITHFASTEDIFHFMSASTDICPAFKEAGERYIGLSRLASVTRYGDKFTAPLLASLRARHRAGLYGDEDAKILVYVLGWLCHRAADRCMKPVFGAFDAKTLRHAEGIDYSPSDCSVYDDAFIYKLYYADDERSLYPRAVFEERMESVPGSEAVDMAGVRALSATMMQNSLLSLQSLSAEDGDFDAWFERLELRRQRFTLEIERYAEAIFRPVPGKVARYITEARFYDESEPILRAAAKLRAGIPVPPDELRAAWSAEPQSSYAHILRTGYHYVETASEFFTGEMDEGELKDRFDVGKPGRDGEAV